MDAGVGDAVPGYMEPLMNDLRDRKKLFDETPPEEVKYWFEYTGPLQVSIVANNIMKTKVMAQREREKMRFATLSPKARTNLLMHLVV